MERINPRRNMLETRTSFGFTALMTLNYPRTFIFAIGLLFAQQAIATPVRVVNAAPELIAIIHEHPDTQGQAAALEKCLQPWSGLYGEVLGMQKLQEQCQQYVRLLASQSSGLARLADDKNVASKLNSYVDSFKTAFPKFDSSELTIYLLPAFGHFQAQARTFQNKPVLLLDSGFFASATQGAIPPAFVHHEMFHIYHGQLCPDVRKGTEDFFRTGQPPSLGTLLWVEGLAVHTARKLDPNATDAELFPSASVVVATQSAFANLVRQATDHADDATMPTISGFFYFPRMDRQPIPQNCGYVIGEKLVDEMLKKNSLEQVMLLKGPDLSSAIRQAAAQLVSK